MIKAELIYNPYIQETKVLFNEKTPRVNSLVEKYIDKPLLDWIDQVPEMFYHEMNGYDFNLEFSGTKLEFKELQRVFNNQYITEKDVRLLHKNELECRDTKIKRLNELTEWLHENPNRRFNFEKTGLVFDELYKVVILNTENDVAESCNYRNISIDYIKNYEEIEHTDLTNTPVIICITDSEYGENFQDLVKKISNRSDISQNQLFFWVLTDYDSEQSRRILQDLQIYNPQIISNINDTILKNYIDMYPVTDYIYNACKVLKSITEQLHEKLKAENEKNFVSNKEIHEQIDLFQGIILNLKESLNLLENRDIINMPNAWKDIADAAKNKISSWRLRKTKITNNQTEAEKVADGFEQEANNILKTFFSELCLSYTKTIALIKKKYKDIYEQSAVKLDFNFDLEECDSENKLTYIPIKNKLLALKQEQYVQRQDKLSFLPFGKKKDENDTLLEVNYYYQTWREFVLQKIEPEIDSLIENYFEKLKINENTVANAYMDQIKLLIGNYTTEKNSKAADLSKEEQELQNDNNWLEIFRDKINEIERN